MKTAYIAVPDRSSIIALLIPLVLSACGSARAEQGVGTVDIGYGEVDGEHVEGSVETLQAGEDAGARTQTLADMLSRVPGVQVSVRGDDLEVRIRGSSSSRPGERPLVVVDGMEYRGALGSINPFNIDRITVLKNAGETAVYGARGGNGVILIKTKVGPVAGEA